MMPVNHCSLLVGSLMTTITIKINKHLNLMNVSFSSFIRWSNYRLYMACG